MSCSSFGDFWHTLTHKPVVSYQYFIITRGFKGHIYMMTWHCPGRIFFLKVYNYNHNSCFTIVVCCCCWLNNCVCRLSPTLFVAFGSLFVCLLMLFLFVCSVKVIIDCYWLSNCVCRLNTTLFVAFASLFVYLLMLFLFVLSK